MSGVSASPPPIFVSMERRPKTRSFRCHHSLSHPKLRLNSLGIRFGAGGLQRDGALRCNSSNNPPPPGSGDAGSKSVLDAFFLGKALAEALNERIESTVGEFLSVVGRLQAEQQKQVQDFQDEVLERAKRAKEKAAREGMEAQGLITKVTTVTEGLINEATTVTEGLINEATTVTEGLINEATTTVTEGLITESTTVTEGLITESTTVIEGLITESTTAAIDTVNSPLPSNLGRPNPASEDLF